MNEREKLLRTMGRRGRAAGGGRSNNGWIRYYHERITDIETYSEFYETQTSIDKFKSIVRLLHVTIPTTSIKRQLVSDIGALIGERHRMENAFVSPRSDDDDVGAFFYEQLKELKPKDVATLLDGDMISKEDEIDEKRQIAIAAMMAGD